MGDLPVIETVGLGVRREGRVLLDHVTFAVARGSVHVVIGPNGAGKSTLLAAMLGHTQFTGSVRAHFRGNGVIGFVPQSLAVDRTLPVTVGEFLALARQRLPICFGIRASTRRRVEALLDRTGLPGFASRRLGALSGGELQRVLLANALDPDPELILLDEPASGLDQPSVRRLEAILLELRRAFGTTVLLVSHDIQQVRRVADAVTWIDRAVRLDGAPSQVLGASPFFPFVEGA